MRELLARQAYDNPAKATAFRASLQALLPAAQEEAVDERTEKACNTIASLTYGLLPDREDVQYRSQLRSLAEEVSQAWHEICCFTDTIEARFDTRRHEDWCDNKFIFEEKQHQIRRLDSLPTDAGDEPIIAIFPRLWAIQEGYYDLETPGVFWMRTQAKASQDELEKAALSARVGKGHPQRVRPRHGSVELYTGQTMATTQSFLDRSSGHD